MLGKSLITFGLMAKVFKWHMNYYLKEQGRPLFATIYVTSNCNFKCKMCDIWSSDIWDIKPPILDIDIYKNIIDDLSVSCYYVDITGGEPLLLNDIVERIKYAKERIPYVTMVTNGSLMTKNIAKGFGDAGLDMIGISIDAIGKKHDELRGVSGAFNDAMNAIETLKENAPGVKIYVNTVVAPWNLDELPALLELVRELNIFHRFIPLNFPFGFEKQYEKTSFCGFDAQNFKKLEQFMSLIIKEAKQSKRIQYSRGLMTHMLDYFKNLSNGKSWKSPIFNSICTIPYFHVEIRPDATVHPCNYNLWRDNFKITEERPLRTIILSEKYKTLQKQLKSCKKCKESMFLCYLEPRLYIPVTNFIKYKIIRRW